MKFKWIMLITLVLLAVLTIGAVSAYDDIADDSVAAVEPTGDAIAQSVEDEKLESNDDSADILTDDEEFEPTVIYPHEFYHNDFYPILQISLV